VAEALTALGRFPYTSGAFVSGMIPAFPLTASIISWSVGTRAPAKRAAFQDPASSVRTSARVNSATGHDLRPFTTFARSGNTLATSVVRSRVVSCRRTSTPSLVS
jgi:hypothetical protein